MSRNRFNFKYEHRELLNDIKNVVISYTPVSGIFDTLKFLNKWLFKRKKVHKLGNGINKRYRMFKLKIAAKRYR
jgi:ABC-type Fe3+-hydroxamate transport system substrate-binding protein